MNWNNGYVLVVDDDPSVRESLSNLVRSTGMPVKTFASAQEFLSSRCPHGPGCLVLDVQLPGLNGLQLQEELVKVNPDMPVIFITGHGDIPMTVRAMKAGAIEFLTKPFRDQDLLDAIQVALDRDRLQHENENVVTTLRLKFESLTPREQEVMACVTGGLLNKQVAAEIGITENTVKVHRGNVTKKMGAKSLAELVRMADVLGVRRAKS